MNSSSAFTFFLGMQELEMGSEVLDGSCMSFLFVCLSWWSSSFSLCRHRENGEEVGVGGEGKALIYLHLWDSLEHENNIKNGSITYRLPGTTESGCEFSLCHPP